MKAKNTFNIATIASTNACFDLQFRKDTRHERTNAPTYYRWKLQFVITGPVEKIKIMERIRKEIDCGTVHTTKTQARFSVQKIEDIAECIVPFFTKNKLTGNKRKDFELWQKAVNIIYQNKGKALTQWKKSDSLNLIQIHKSIAQYKSGAKQPKWIKMAHRMVHSA